MFAEFINQYGMELLYTVITAIAGYIGIVLKNLCVNYMNDKTKRDVAKSAVQFVEQVYKDVHGEEKLNEALIAATDMLNEKGIVVNELEMRVLIEAAVAEFNNAFSKTTEKGENQNGK